MFLKLTGALLLVGGSFAMARHLNKTEETKLSYADGWISMIKYVQAQVECYSLPVEDILSGCDKGMLELCGYTSDIQPSSFAMLSEAIYKGDGDIGKTLEKFFSEFGSCYREEQVRRCAHCLTSLEERRATIKEQLPIKKRININL